MELIDGQPLSAQLKAGPLALEDAMRVAIQVADALKRRTEGAFCTGT